MRTTRTLLRAVLALAAFSCACGGTVVAPGHEPSITQIAPSRAVVGDKVTIVGSGFLPSGNGVRIGSGYLLGVPSPDGTTLQFALPSYLGVCPPGSGACIQLALQLAPGTYQVSVVNDHGTSNQVTFEVIQQ